MIRINLLPFRLARKKENIRQQISIFFLSILLVLAGIFWYVQGIKQNIEQKRYGIARIDAEIQMYQEKSDQVSTIRKRLKILEDKLEIVESLKQRRDEQLMLLEDLQVRLVPEQMWIETLHADVTSVTLTGVAFDNPTIADFMRRLEASDLFQEIDLKQTMMKKLNEDTSLKAFELKCLKRSAMQEQKTLPKGENG